LQKKEAAFRIDEMNGMDPKKLLRNKKVIEEINRHKWLESEIAGYDIGFEAAAEDWLKKHAGVWVDYHANKKSQSIPPKKKRPAK
jgi:hypothetical protein